MTSTLQNSEAAKQWKKIGIRHHNGINIPLFSLHSLHSCGIGEYPDLLPLIKWCKELGLDIIQLLPLNDIGHDTSPYSALSAFALNPLYLGLAQLPYVEEYPSLLTQIKELQKLDDLQRIDYASVNSGKDAFLKEYFQNAGNRIMETHSYKQFLIDNPWLEIYALFKALKIQAQWQSWESWPDERKNPNPETFKKLLQEFRHEVDYHIFVQYLCFEQFKEVKKKAHASGILLKGDIPILINRDSADVWFHRSLFLMQYTAGAPPDLYSLDGQNWGFPIYNWEQIEKENYSWWIQRLKVAEMLYDLYRLDHIVGFYRIWAIPLGKSGKEGKFIPEDSNTWIKHGEKIMKVMLENCTLLPIGEDLGTVPPEVRTNLKSLGICGTKVMRWERMWNEDKRFIEPKNYPQESMTTVSTHDSETLKLWWEKFPEDSRELCKFKEWAFTYELPLDQQQEILFDSHHSGSYFHINLLSEYLALVHGMTWMDPQDERINIPGVVSERNWTYRFRPTVEEIVENKQLRDIMRSILK